jgi:hypothetical protein
VYRPQDAEHTVLHQVVAEHLETFLASVAEAGDGAGLPQFVEREFREFLTCGVFEHGVARFRCEGCRREHLVPFSCLYEPGPTRRWLKVKQSGSVAEDRWQQRISTGA